MYFLKVFFCCFIMALTPYYSAGNRPAIIFCWNCFSPELVYFGDVKPLAKVEIEKLKDITGTPYDITCAYAICSLCRYPYYGYFGMSLNPINSKIIFAGWGARDLKKRIWFTK